MTFFPSIYRKKLDTIFYFLVSSWFSTRAFGGRKTLLLCGDGATSWPSTAQAPSRNRQWNRFTYAPLAIDTISSGSWYTPSMLGLQWLLAWICNGTSESWVATVEMAVLFRPFNDSIAWSVFTRQDLNHFMLSTAAMVLSSLPLSIRSVSFSSTILYWYCHE